MKTLDLNAYGVQEMSHQEMVETNGGFLPLVVFAVKKGFKIAATYKKTTVVSGSIMIRGCS